LRQWVFSRITCRAKTRRTFGTLELLGLIEDYRQGLVPLIVPLKLLKHHLNRYPVPEWVPVPSAASGTPAGVPPSVSQGFDAVESYVDRDRSQPCQKPAKWGLNQAATDNQEAGITAHTVR
jgi:hypothetical protein